VASPVAALAKWLRVDAAGVDTHGVDTHGRALRARLREIRTELDYRRGHSVAENFLASLWAREGGCMQ
jgi:hypothetical protein